MTVIIVLEFDGLSVDDGVTVNVLVDVGVTAKYDALLDFAENDPTSPLSEAVNVCGWFAAAHASCGS